MGKDITIVSAFYDIGRGDWHPTDIQCLRRTIDQYFTYFNTLAEIKNPMVVVTSEQFADRIFDIRRKHGMASMTNIIVKELDPVQRARAHDVVKNGIFRNFVLSKEIPEFKMPDYSVVTNQKSRFVIDAINAGYVNTSQCAWIDFGYCRAPKWFNAEKPWEYDFGDKINMWIMRNLDDRPIFDVVRTAMVYFMGCHIVGPTTAWRGFNDSWQQSFNALLECGFTDDDQTTMLMIWRKNPELFALRAGVDAGPGSWYYILNQFNDNAAPILEPPYRTKPAAQPMHNLTFDAGVLRF